MEFTGRGRNRGEAFAGHLGPAVSGTLGNVLHGRDVGLEDDREGGKTGVNRVSNQRSDTM